MEPKNGDTIGRRIREAQQPRPVPTPKWVRTLSDNWRETVLRHLVDRHLFPDGPVWGLARFDPDSPLPFDEVGSAMFLDAVRTYDLFEDIGGWNEETKREVVAFWQNRQDPETGRFVDPEDPERAVNEKYIVGLLRGLGAKPCHRYSSTSTTGAVDSAIFLMRTANDADWERGGWGVGSHTGGMAVTLLQEAEKGRPDLLPAVARGIEQILSHQDPQSGLWGPPQANLGARIGGTLKVMGRFYFALGIIVPHTERLADSLIRHQRAGDFLRSGVDICILRNVAEVMAYCLEASPYRREELWEALALAVEDLRTHINDDGSVSWHRGKTGGVTFPIHYPLGICGYYLNWRDCPMPSPLAEGTRGRGYRHEILVDEAGHVGVRARDAEF